QVAAMEADVQLVWGEPRDLTLPTLEVPAISEVRLDRSAVVVVGTPVAGATDYDAALVDGDGQPWPEWVDGYVDQLPGPDDDWPPTAHLGATFADGARVGARMRARSEVCAGPWSDPGTFDPLAAAWLTVRFLPGVGYAFANDLPSGVRIWWTPVSAEVDGYRLTLTDTNTEDQPPLTYDVPAATEPGAGPLTDLTVGTTYAVCVQARVGRSFGPPSETIRVRRSPHTPASLTYLGYDGGRLTANWRPADPQGPSYEVELTGPDGAIVIATEATGDTFALEFPPPDGTDVWPAGEYSLRLRANRWDEPPRENPPGEPSGDGDPAGTAAESQREPWSEYARITRLGGPPPLTGVTRSGDSITTAWEPVADADLYRLELHGTGPSPARLVTPGTSVTLLPPAPATTPETDLRVRVRAENARGDLLPGPWTELTGPVTGAAPYLKLSGDGWGSVRYRTRDHRRPDVGVNTLYNLMNDGFTLEAEVRVDGLTGDRPILRVAQAEGSPYLADGPSLLLFLREGHAAFGMTCYTWDSGVPSNPRLQVMTAPGPITIGTWTHLAVTQPYSGPTILYVDGQEVARSHFSATYPGFDVYEVGRSGTDHFTGYLREIRVWKGPRPAEDLHATIAQDLRPRLAELIPHGLGAYWPLRDGSGTTATDVIDANNLALEKTTWQTP
ncbi:LamG-like jellyroll fold domain-containing protein, partial [Frankia sp. AgKG'84/4]|uniref:LamG-like jellyroll fold domain-containing protein n=1 Tax=Frankia sp. AgKG'84/4 TaxID=573490 RepID=UPI002029F266